MKTIPLSTTSKKNAGKYFAKVDDDDYEFLMQWKWHFIICKNKYIYAVRLHGQNTKKAKAILMHRVILGLSKKNIVGDHIDGDTLNNQRYNLRKATASNNSANRKASKNGTSKYLGVHWHNYHKKWASKLRRYNKVIHLGYFENEIEAAKAYDIAAKKYHGDFARLNFKEKE